MKLYDHETDVALSRRRCRDRAMAVVTPRRPTARPRTPAVAPSRSPPLDPTRPDPTLGRAPGVGQIKLRLNCQIAC